MSNKSNYKSVRYTQLQLFIIGLKVKSTHHSVQKQVQERKNISSTKVNKKGNTSLVTKFTKTKKYTQYGGSIKDRERKQFKFDSNTRPYDDVIADYDPNKYYTVW